MNKKRKRTIVALSVLLVVILVGATIAFFTNTTTFNNNFKLSKYKTTTTETFESPTNWQPGEEVPKTIVTTNEGTIPAAVRVSYKEKWEDKEGNPITTIPANAVTINLDNTTDWVQEGNYYYYNKVLQPGETTTSFMKSVTLNPTIGNEKECKTEGNKEVCESKTTGIEGAKYTLTITKETVQADAYKTAWNTNVEITGDTGSPVTPSKPSSISFVNRQNADSITTGDLLKIGDEEFYVVSSNSDKTTLLAHYNLNVGDNRNLAVEEGVQHSSVKGWLPSTSSDPKYGTVAFSTTNYWYDGSNIKSEYGSSYPAYVYDNNSNLYTYVENYKTILESKGVTISEARLLKHEEAVTLGCNASGGSNACASAPAWVSETTYWIGSANNSSSVWRVLSNGSSNLPSYNDADYSGVRPVIEISTSEITG